MKNAILALVAGVIVIGTAYNPTKAVYQDYSRNDPDFAESHYIEQNRLGDTDFFGYVKPDGSIVILEEDMKWIVTGGDLDEITERLEGFENKLLTLRAEGKTAYTNDNWIEWATDAIEGH